MQKNISLSHLEILNSQRSLLFEYSDVILESLLLNYSLPSLHDMTLSNGA